MRVSKVLLRWYRSFNINYVGYPDRRDGAVNRPWNLLGREATDEVVFPFIEIPIEHDITTVVGANESGKSHLLNALSKVLTGKGLDEEDDFDRTDLCHFSSIGNKDADAWPNIGIEILIESEEEFKKVISAIGVSTAPTYSDKENRAILILKTNDSGLLYIGSNDSATSLDGKRIAELRKILPTLKFLDSRLAMADHVAIASLIAAYDHTRYISKPLYDEASAQKAAEVLEGLTLHKGRAIEETLFEKLTSAKTQLERGRINVDSAGILEALLFREILGIRLEALEYLGSLDLSDRSSADGLVSTWNGEIAEKLNLSRYWQQDDQFSLQINYKNSVLYFEIKDKTKSTYTFRERSSGLRYFLSYYIQAKALELSHGNRNSVILMDEPDSFLSTLGQKNLLTIFESLVSPDSATGACQLLYTTHSPFLVNRNFPRRIRLLRKGDAEEGTQFIDQAFVRRYEPIRSALGIDCAQTLFMGATNLVLEGPTDQFLLTELVRLFSTQETIEELIDLNKLTLVSAESATRVEKLLEASQWGDEPIPATVVLLDSDSMGDEIFRRITGRERNRKRMIDDEFVGRIREAITSNLGPVITIEDILPAKLFFEAIVAYFSHWYSDVAAETLASIRDFGESPDVNKDGLEKAARRVFEEMARESGGYDKMGVMQELLRITDRIQKENPNDPELQQLKKNVFSLTGYLRKKIESSQESAKRRSGKQAVQRIIHDFLITHKKSANTFEMQQCVERLQSEADALGKDGEILKGTLVAWNNRVQELRDSGVKRLNEPQWKKWELLFTSVHHNPLNPEAAMEATLTKSNLESALHEVSASDRSSQ